LQFAVCGPMDTDDIFCSLCWQKKNLGVCYYARSVNACPFQNKYHTHLFPPEFLPCYWNFQYRLAFQYRGWNVCTALSFFFKFKMKIRLNEGLFCEKTLFMGVSN
jgi:hypothetical protein